MNDEKPGAIDQALFRQVMGSFATGVTVITIKAHGEPRGMTVNAFMSGSLDPPLCVISIGKSARMYPFLKEAGHFGISILARGQERLSAHFGGRPDPDLQPAYRHIGTVPVLADAAATITATIVGHHDCGDHTIFIGHIHNMSADNRAPLVYHAGHYAAIAYVGDLSASLPEFW